MSVVFFGSTDGFMPQQFLHSANIGAAGEQLNREGIAEAVRMGVDAGGFTNSGYCAPERLGSLHFVRFLLVAQSHEAERLVPSVRLVAEFALGIGVGLWRRLPLRLVQ